MVEVRQLLQFTAVPYLRTVSTNQDGRLLPMQLYLFKHDVSKLTDNCDSLSRLRKLLSTPTRCDGHNSDKLVSMISAQRYSLRGCRGHSFDNFHFNAVVDTASITFTSMLSWTQP